MGEWWYGILGDGVVKVRQEGDTLRVSSSTDTIERAAITSYFRLDDDFQSILASLMKEPRLTNAIQKFYGLRLLKQDFWECLASYVLATNSNIPRIKGMIGALSKRFGNVLSFEGLDYFSFPKADTLASASLSELRNCGLGYRAEYLNRVARVVSSGEFGWDEFPLLDYDAAHRALLRVLAGEKLLLGVGPKVADCVLLYSGMNDEAFPIDVWIARELTTSFPEFFGAQMRRRLTNNDKSKISASEYRVVSSAARRNFGRYAGYAQMYLFVSARNSL